MVDKRNGKLEGSQESRWAGGDTLVMAIRRRVLSYILIHSREKKKTCKSFLLNKYSMLNRVVCTLYAFVYA